MSIEDYFGDWSKVINLGEANRLMNALTKLKQPICPLPRDVFKAFSLCTLDSLRVIILGQDPYPDYKNGKPTATGIAFGNSIDTPNDCYSPSLDVLMESVIDFTRPHGIINFDPSLEKWERQGVLMLNSALSCLAGRPGSHSLMWRPFIRELLTNLSKYDTCMAYVLMGTEAQSFEPYIDHRLNHVMKVKHPSWYARNHQKMPTDLWYRINDILDSHNGSRVEWYNEYKFLNETETNEEVFFAGHC